MIFTRHQILTNDTPTSIIHDIQWVDNSLSYTSRSRQNGRHFADGHSKCIFLNENVWIYIKISPRFLIKGVMWHSLESNFTINPEKYSTILTNMLTRNQELLHWQERTTYFINKWNLSSAHISRHNNVIVTSKWHTLKLIWIPKGKFLVIFQWHNSVTTKVSYNSKPSLIFITPCSLHGRLILGRFGENWKLALFVITSVTGGCRYKNIWCRHWGESWRHDNSWVSVYLCYPNPNNWAWTHEAWWHIHASVKWDTIGSGMAWRHFGQVRCRTFTWSNADLLSTWTPRKNLPDIWFKIEHF